MEFMRGHCGSVFGQPCWATLTLLGLNLLLLLERGLAFSNLLVTIRQP